MYMLTSFEIFLSSMCMFVHIYTIVHLCNQLYNALDEEVISSAKEFKILFQDLKKEKFFSSQQLKEPEVLLSHSFSLQPIKSPGDLRNWMNNL